MITDTKPFLCQFDTPQYVDQASFNVFSVQRHMVVPELIRDAVKGGLIRVLDGGSIIGDLVWHREMMLQQQLPGAEDVDLEEPGAEVQQSPGTAENWPISELGVKRIKAIVGKEAFDAAKENGDPIGLSDKQLESLEAQDWTTIGAMEKSMNEDSWWHKKVAKNPDAQIIQRVISTLLAFRKVNPFTEEKTPTVLDNLKEANAPEAEQVPAESAA